MLRHLRAICLLAVLALSGTSLQAQSRSIERSGFHFSGALGAANLRGSLDVDGQSGSTSFDDGGGHLFLRFGGSVSPNVLLGGELTGTVIGDGAGTGGLFAVGIFYPSRSNFFLKGGLGLVAYEEDSIDGSAESTSGALMIGAGYDVRIGRNKSLALYADVLQSAKGNVEQNGFETNVNFSQRIVTLGLAFSTF